MLGITNVGSGVTLMGSTPTYYQIKIKQNERINNRNNRRTTCVVLRISKLKVMNYTTYSIEVMYLDWFNNFLSCEAWREHYDLTIAEGENILDMGRQLNNLRDYE
tara:strand:+ start:149 stop:463 length:315 start_codon:yes stop_codon:yes gene_type:complete